jgi:hypothetical protein
MLNAALPAHCSIETTSNKGCNNRRLAGDHLEHLQAVRMNMHDWLADCCVHTISRHAKAPI